MRQKYYSIENISIEIPKLSLEKLAKQVQIFWSENSKSCAEYSEVWEQMVLDEAIEAYGNNGGKAYMCEEIPFTISRTGKTETKYFDFDDDLTFFLKKVDFEFSKMSEEIVSNIINS